MYMHAAIHRILWYIRNRERERDAQHEAKTHFNILIFHKQSIFKLIDSKTKNKD
jgi:hypothetical protein